jgi:hypothetical protein
VTPFFKTHYSIGRSIMRPERIFEIAKTRELSQVIFVEDSFAGFRKTFQLFDGSGIQMIFGIRLPVVQSSKEEKPSKLVFFAKNDAGVLDIKKLFTRTHCSDDGLLVFGELKPADLKNIKIAVPFYDSFIFNNIFHFGMSDLKLKEFDHFFIEEKNNHPFDFLISEGLDSLGVERQMGKSIYYENYDDFDAFQFYKSTTNRSGGKSPNYGNPMLDHFCSNEFCWESYLLNK